MNIPEGFVLVPVEPTVEQEELGCQSYMAADGRSTWVMHKSSMGHAYRAMIAAAPPVELPAYDEAKERALFESWYGDLPVSKFKETMWMSWEACAKSRARSAK